MNLILFDDQDRTHFYPLTLTRPLSLLRLGIQTLAEKWERISSLKPSYLVPEYLSEAFPIYQEEDNIFINSRLIPSLDVWKSVKNLPLGAALTDQGRVLASRLNKINPKTGFIHSIHTQEGINIEYGWLNYLEDFVQLNGEQIILDFEALSQGRISSAISTTNKVLGNRVFINGVIQAEYAIFNSETGPIYIEEGVQIMEGALLRGPLAILQGSIIKMGSKIYGSSSIGPHCSIGGEVKNSNLTGFSNKSHEGYLGDAIVGQWCNLGADTNNSNMKNNYGKVRLYDYTENQFRVTENMFLGVMMGDHVKCGINSTINTGTVFGVGVNWFGSALTPGFIPDFTWADSGNFTEYRLEKMLETASLVMQRRQKTLSDIEKTLLRRIFEMTQNLRTP